MREDRLEQARLHGGEEAKQERRRASWSLAISVEMSGSAGGRCCGQECPRSKIALTFAQEILIFASR
jgi:hypothetical protein